MEALCSGKGAVVRVLAFSGPLSFAAVVAAFAGGADTPKSRTFGAYEVDFDCGAVGVTIQGHASEQSVTIDNLATDHLSASTETGDVGITNTNAALSVGSTTGNQRMDQIYGAISTTSASGSEEFR